MKTSLLSLLAGGVMLAGVASVSAAEPFVLSSSDLDTVTAANRPYKKFVKIDVTIIKAKAKSDVDVTVVGDSGTTQSIVQTVTQACVYASCSASQTANQNANKTVTVNVKKPAPPK